MDIKAAQTQQRQSPREKISTQKLWQSSLLAPSWNPSILDTDAKSSTIQNMQ